MASTMAMSYSTPFLNPLSNGKSLSNHTSRRSHLLKSKLGVPVPKTWLRFSCSLSMTDGQYGDHEKLKLDYIVDKAKRYWDEIPQPVKSFPWNEVLDNFIQRICDVAVVLIKYLSAPVLAVSSLSEMSYCAQERKLFFVPVPMVLGFVVAGILKEKASESLPVIKDAVVPWHLISIAIFFILLKLPGPYYPYLGRICIPHFANGGLWRVFWMITRWHHKSGKTDVDAKMQQSLETSQ